MAKDYIEEAIDDLSINDSTIVISRELLRHLGLLDFAFKTHPNASGEGPRNIDTVRWRLAIARSLLTLMVPIDHAVVSSVLQQVQRTRVGLSAAAGTALRTPMRIASILNTLDALLTSVQSEDSEDLFKATDGLHRLAIVSERANLRYAHDDLLILVPPADRAWAVPLWAEQDVQPSEATCADAHVPDRLNYDWTIGLDGEDSRSSFWKRWYDGMVRGDPLDWDLQRRIALIPNDIWDQGPTAVAEKIESIEAEWRRERQGTEPRAPEYEPSRIDHLLQNAPAISATLSANALGIQQNVTLFEYGINDVPAFVAPLKAIPAKLEKVSQILQKSRFSEVDRETLQIEIGRLRALAEKLEEELKEARNELSVLKEKSWWKPASLTISTCIATFVGALWVLSGDELGPDKRVDTLIEYRDFLWERITLPSSGSSPPDDAPRLVWPETFDT